MSNYRDRPRKWTYVSVYSTRVPQGNLNWSG